ncbi:MAG: hypothetical protein U0T81_09370 [Saprospiraceae bacterium]
MRFLIMPSCYMNPHLMQLAITSAAFEKVIYTPFQPTRELLLLHFKNQIAGYFNAPVRLVHMRLEETRVLMPSGGIRTTRMQTCRNKKRQMNKRQKLLQSISCKLNKTTITF